MSLTTYISSKLSPIRPKSINISNGLCQVKNKKQTTSDINSRGHRSHQSSRSFWWRISGEWVVFLMQGQTLRVDTPPPPNSKPLLAPGSWNEEVNYLYPRASWNQDHFIENIKLSIQHCSPAQDQSWVCAMFSY